MSLAAGSIEGCAAKHSPRLTRPWSPTQILGRNCIALTQLPTHHWSTSSGGLILFTASFFPPRTHGSNCSRHASMQTRVCKCAAHCKRPNRRYSGFDDQSADVPGGNRWRSQGSRTSKARSLHFYSAALSTTIPAELAPVHKIELLEEAWRSSQGCGSRRSCTSVENIFLTATSNAGSAHSKDR
jgi:hypothetical protein